MSNIQYAGLVFMITVYSWNVLYMLWSIRAQLNRMENDE